MFRCPKCKAEETSIAINIPVTVTWSAWVSPDTGEIFSGELDEDGTPSLEPDEVQVQCVECDTPFDITLERNEYGFPLRVLSLTPIG